MKKDINNCNFQHDEFEGNDSIPRISDGSSYLPLELITAKRVYEDYLTFRKCVLMGDCVDLNDKEAMEISNSFIKWIEYNYKKMEV